jgi:hypothetical protein
MSIIIMAAASVERVLLIRILKVVISVVEVATSPVLFLLVQFVIADNFAVSDISVIWDAFQRDEETCVGSWNILNALKQTPAFVAKTSRPEWLEAGILHKSCVFHFLAGGRMDD